MSTKTHEWIVYCPLAGGPVTMEGTRAQVRREAIRQITDIYGATFGEVIRSLRVSRADLQEFVLCVDGDPEEVAIRGHGRTCHELSEVVSAKHGEEYRASQYVHNGWARFSVGLGEDGPCQFLEIVDGPGRGAFQVTWAAVGRSCGTCYGTGAGGPSGTCLSCYGTGVAQ